MAPRLRTFLIRSAFLFLISLVLVAGFWYHREFYQIGFTNLLIIGGLVTFLVIWAARLALSGELPRGRPRGELTFSVEEGDRLLKAGSRLVVRQSARGLQRMHGCWPSSRFGADVPGFRPRTLRAVLPTSGSGRPSSGRTKGSWRPFATTWLWGSCSSRTL